MRLQDSNECLVVGMGNIRFQCGFIRKREKEAVGESVVETFNTFRKSPFDRFDPLNPTFEKKKLVDDPLDVIVSSGILEFKKYRMTKL